MILKDKSLNRLIDIPHGTMSYAILAMVTVLILVAGYFKNQSNDKESEAKQTA